MGGFHLECTRFDWGLAYYGRYGRVVPEEFLTTLRSFDAIFFQRLGKDRLGLRGNHMKIGIRSTGCRRRAAYTRCLEFMTRSFPRVDGFCRAA